MNWSRNKKWFTLALMGTIVPISLLVTFKLTGILPSPTIAETFTADTVSWNMERPNENLQVSEAVENSYTDEVSVHLNILVGHYIEHWEPYGGRDLVDMNVSMTANSRKGISYRWYGYDYYWIDENDLAYRNENVTVGDDNGTWINIPQNESAFEFRFYGGLYSFEYRRVWVCTNGFISFDLSNSTKAYPSDIPSTEEPNAIIAALWTDLEIDENARIISGRYYDPYYFRYVFVIMWKNAKLPNGNRVTFEIILENAPGWYPAERRATQSKIWISYKSTDLTGVTYARGIEDQEGQKGLGERNTGGSLGESASICFEQQSNPFFLKCLTLTFSDTNTNTGYYIYDETVKGYHLNEGAESTPDPTLMFATALQELPHCLWV